ncbi:hypothetical protein N7467_006377 [Penicillium canescens]|nr:hypothetical protein N7467_006377 [Penicillium canescens]
MAGSEATEDLKTAVQRAQSPLEHFTAPGTSLGSNRLDIVSRGDPIAVSRRVGLLDVFLLGDNNHIYHRWWDGQWQPRDNWQDLGTGFDSSPTAVSWGPERFDIFTTRDNIVCHRWFDATHNPQWSEWEFLGGMKFKNSPAVVSWATGRLDLFGIGTNNHIYHRWWDGQWQPQDNWQDLGTGFDSSPTAVSWGPERFDIFTTRDNIICHRWFDATHNPQWSEWEFLGGMKFKNSPAVVSWVTGRLDLFGIGTNNHIYHRWWDGQWQPQDNWQDLGTGFDSSPTAVSWGPKRFDIFTTRDNIVCHRWFDATHNPQWSEWEFLGGMKFKNSPAVASWATGRLDLFGIGTDIYHKWWGGGIPLRQNGQFSLSGI